MWPQKVAHPGCHGRSYCSQIDSCLGRQTVFNTLRRWKQIDRSLDLFPCNVQWSVVVAVAVGRVAMVILEDISITEAFNEAKAGRFPAFSSRTTPHTPSAQG